MWEALAREWVLASSAHSGASALHSFLRRFPPSSMNVSSSACVNCPSPASRKREVHRKKPQRFNHLAPVPQKRLEMVMNVSFLLDSQEKIP